MRILVFQTPKLTYVQALEFLLRETQERPADLALLPEFALEHPAQCTHQGELSYDNVAIMMLSRLARQRQLYLVLGVRDSDSVDICLVFNRQGDMTLHKVSECPSFQTEWGTVALLGDVTGSWAPLLALAPVLILNPCNAPMELDMALAKAHPELQVAAWHKGFRRTERLVQSRLRDTRTVFVRADAPLRQGGAGISMLVEAHRSALAPSWGPTFLHLEMEDTKDSRKLPKWRSLTIDEILSASYGRDLNDAVEIGPRYHLWTFRPPSLAKAAMTQTADWSSLWEQPEADTDILSLMGRQASCFLMPLGRFYVVAERSGQVTLWDLRQRRECQTFSVDGAVGFGFGLDSSRSRSGRATRATRAARVTCLGPGPLPNQFAVATSSAEGVVLRLFERKLLRDFALPLEDLPWQQWKPFPANEGAEGADQGADGAPERVREKVRDVRISAIFWVSSSLVVAIAESENLPEVVLRLDLEASEVEVLDIYLNGPPPASFWEESQDTLSDEPSPSASTASELSQVSDQLVMVMAFERVKFPETRSPQSGLVCLWRSDRLCILTFSDWKVHDQVLVDDTGAPKDKEDMPLCATILPGDGACSVVASYASMIIRWWRVSLTSCFQQACVVLSSPVTQLSLLQCGEEARERERARLSWMSSSHRLSLKESKERTERSSTRDSSEGHKPSRVSTLDGLAESSATILVCTVDKTGTMTLFSGQGSNLKRVYTCLDLSWSTATTVDSIWVMETHIALLQRNGDVRHMEFDVNGELMKLSELFDGDG
ncbi:unnamed protein product [Effrenium voratum]|uniref:Uncharacterized protein n=1 Tax=Effrenium voratum TaxID=2562239 RepID=A0AA36MNW2_9DINO|nr:unnamed protein product [Effrenium voratum]CAJ1456980.1 unnamed protein product [Effrenium voratum]